MSTGPPPDMAASPYVSVVTADGQVDPQVLPPARSKPLSVSAAKAIFKQNR